MVRFKRKKNYRWRSWWKKWFQKRITVYDPKTPKSRSTETRPFWLSEKGIVPEGDGGRKPVEAEREGSGTCAECLGGGFVREQRGPGSRKLHCNPKHRDPQLVAGIFPACQGIEIDVGGKHF